MQVLPSINLTPFIKHYLFLESHSEKIKGLRLFSDGNTSIVFSFGKNLISNINSQSKHSLFPHSFFYGQLSDFKDLYFVNNICLVIVVFQPTGIYQLLNIPAYELKDNVIETENIFGKKIHFLQEQLYEQRNIKDRLFLLNSYFSKLAEERIVYTDTLTTQTVNYILKNKGLATIEQLVKYTGYTERHIERSFNRSIGLTPKKYSTIAKLHYYLGLIRNKKLQDNLTVKSYEAGYTDQSHAIQNFKKLTGITPKIYLKNNNHLTVNLIELY